MNFKKMNAIVKKVLLSFICVLLLGASSWGQVSITSLPQTTTQNFDGLSSTSTVTWSDNSTLANWYATAGSLTIGTGTGTSGSLYNFGSTSASDRSLGALSSSGASPQFGIRIKNNSGSAIGSLNISFNGEQWRQTTNSQSLVFDYLVSSSAITSVTPSGTFTTNTTFDFAALKTGTAGALDGNLAANRSAISGTLTVSIPSGSEILLRWSKTGTTSPGLSIDDLSITANSAATPSIAISNQHPTAANITQGSTNNILGIYQLDVTTANATLTGMSVTTAGSYTSSDIQTNGFKFWTNSAANLTGATQLGSSQAAVNSGGTVAVSGQSFSITSGTTRYVIVTADVAINATTSNTISLAIVAFSNITFSSGNKTGTDPVAASNAMTITACTLANVTSASATNGNTQSIVSWTNATCQDEVMIVAATAANTGTPTGNGSLYTANATYASGTSIGNGFVVYKGSTSGQTITGLTNGTQYFFKIFTRRGTTWTSGVEVTATPAQVTTATDYFRSNVTTGTWATASSWQSSNDNTNWITATLVPDNNANTITIRNGHNITLSSSVNVDQLVIENGGQLTVNSTSGTLNINDGTGHDVDVQSGGVLQVTGTASYSTTIIFSGSASMNVSGKVTAGDGTNQTGFSGYGAFGSAAASQIIWNNGSVFEWNTLTGPPATSGLTYFQSANTTTIPIFRITAMPSNPGGGSATIINGQIQLNGTNLTWAGAGLKTFRNGVTAIGTATMAVSSTGAWQIGDASVGAAEIGGSGATLTLTNANGISITANCTATLSSNTTIGTSTLLTNNGTLTCGTNTLSGAGSFTQAATGTIITSNTGGVASTIGVSGTKTYTAGCNFTFNGNTTSPFPSSIGSNQVGTINVNANVTSNYSNNLIVTSAFNVNSGSLILNGTNHLVLNNAVPLTIASNATFDNGGESQIQINSGTPTVTINGTFITRDAQGFTGSNTAIPSITPTLGSNSIIEYGLSGNQTVTDFAYRNLTFSGSGIKSTTGAISSITGTVTINSGVTLNSGTSTFGGSGTNLTMLGTSKFITGGSSTTPDAQGSYNLASTSTIEFSGSSSTIIRSSPSYGNIDITGINVSLSGVSTSLQLQSGSTFTVKSGGTFNVQNTNGFTGASNTAISTTNSPAISLLNGSTINYNGSQSQTITNRNDYKGLRFSNNVTRTLNFDLSVAEALTLTSASDILAINGNTLTIAGSFAGSGFLRGSNTSKLVVTSTSNAGTINFDQTTSADVSTTNGTNALQNLVVSGTGGSVTLGNKLNLFDRLSVSAGTLNTGDNLVLRSTSSNTAYVDQVGGSISGQATVERYIHKQFRGWRMITAPVTFNGIISADNDKIKNNWQSDFGYSSNYGTRVTAKVTPSVGNGLDDFTNGASLLTYNSTGAGSWNRIENTLTETVSGSSASAANKGFFMYVRGDRSVLPTNTGTPNAFVSTTLASKGLLQTGPQLFNYGGSANVSWIVGNPYAAPVDMSAVTYNNIPNAVYVWDPNLTGSSAINTGAYTMFDRSNWGLGPVAGSMTKFFQSGQAFLVKPTSGTASISFDETHKSTSTNNNTNTTGSINGATDIFNVKLNTVQSNGDRTNVDGVRAKYGNYSATIDAEDITKISGSLENLGLSRNATNLSIEARPFITGEDSLHLSMSNMSVGSNYEFFINPINFDASVTSCKIVDRFLNTETAVSTTVNTVYPFTVTSVTGSNDANRFVIVFNGAGPLPVREIKVQAAKKNNTVLVDFVVANEEGVAKYEVEKSATANNFVSFKELAANNNNQTNNYSVVDNNPSAVNYYRIKATGTNNKVVYSSVVKVEMNSKSAMSVSVYPNPVVGNTIGLQLTNIAEGIATLKIYNNLGHLIATQSISNTSSSSSLTIDLENKLAAGIYQIQLTDAKGNEFTERLIKK